MFNNKKNILLISLLVLFFIFSTTLPAQEDNVTEVSITLKVPAIALINFIVDGNQMITYSYSYSGPEQVEQIITPLTGDKTWLNYSSVVNEGLTNYITAHISSGTLPADVTLNVYVSSDVGSGAGLMGTSLGKITLSSYPKNIIVNIGSCYTGVGLYKGHQLTYAWKNPDSYNYELMYENGEAIAVTYTITSTE